VVYFTLTSGEGPEVVTESGRETPSEGSPGLRPSSRRSRRPSSAMGDGKGPRRGIFVQPQQVSYRFYECVCGLMSVVVDRLCPLMSELEEGDQFVFLRVVGYLCYIPHLAAQLIQYLLHPRLPVRSIQVVETNLSATFHCRLSPSSPTPPPLPTLRFRSPLLSSLLRPAFVPLRIPHHPPMSRLNVLIYSGSGVSSTSRDYALQSLKTYLSHAYDVQLASTKVLQEGHWTSSCALLVFPGGRDLPFMHDLAGAPNRRIREYVEQGGAYLGFCAGAYYGSSNVEFQVGDKILEVVGERELGFYKGVCRGTTFVEPPFEYDSEKGARECRVELERISWRDYWEQSPGGLEVYYNGGGAFYSRREGEEERGVEVLARYGDVEGKPAAGVCCTVGEGRAILWGVHPEHPLMGPGSGEGNEERRQGLLRATLAMLRLDVSASPARPPHLLPLFLTSSNPTLLSNTAKALALARGENASLQDRNDTFVLHPMSDLGRTVTAARTRPRTFDPEELKECPKDVILCDPVPDVKLTPLFDIPLYFSLLAKARGSTTPLFGDTMLYSETVTSTQTMLDK
jgi:glutamine amidotransferase-like uncharacterized protein